jgi:hypothetical protein
MLQTSTTNNLLYSTVHSYSRMTNQSQQQAQPSRFFDLLAHSRKFKELYGLVGTKWRKQLTDLNSSCVWEEYYAK